MSSKSFFDILEEQIRREIRAEMQAEYQHTKSQKPAAPARPIELWLISHLEKMSVPKSKAAGANYYRSAAQSQPKKKAEPPSLRPAGVAENAALELFRREGGLLQEKPNAAELKSAFRSLALKLHPDRHAHRSPQEQAAFAVRFRAIVECYETLSGWLNESCDI